MDVVVAQTSGATVAAGTHADLAGAGARLAALRIARGRIRQPRHALALVERDGEAFGLVLALCRIVSGGPLHMTRTRAVARFAGDVQFRPRRAERIGGGIVVLAQVGGMALG